jgi:hypothetical protein
MKITSADYAELRRMLDEWHVEQNSRNLDEAEAEYVAAGHSLKRFRWDALYAVPYATRVAWFDRVYAYANDTHIDTVLRAYFGHKA